MILIARKIPVLLPIVDLVSSPAPSGVRTEALTGGAHRGLRTGKPHRTLSLVDLVSRSLVDLDGSGKSVEIPENSWAT